MRLLICAGGTGGGVYPALAVLDALKRLAPNLETLWVGGEGGMEEELIRREEIPFQSIPAAGVHGVGLRALPGNLTRLARGVRRSSEILRRFQPDALFFTGGYVAAPMALAGRRIPSLLYVPGHITLYLGRYKGEPVIMHTYWGIRLKDWSKYPLCRTIITTTEPGKELRNIRERSKLINTLQQINTF